MADRGESRNAAGIGLLQQQIERQVAEIRQNLTQLNGCFAEFLCTWDTLGTHLRNAYTKYDDGQKRLDRLGLQLGQIQQPPCSAESPARAPTPQ